jgi:probable rRNA maturation factor
VIEVILEDRGWRAAEPRAVALAKAAAKATLAHEKAARGAGVVILLADDAGLAQLNHQFRGKDGPTNVLSFPAADPGDNSLGDIALALGVCTREAGEQGKTLAAHLQHLTTHGVLHLLGYDHETDAEAEAMEAKERAILATLGLADPYRPG